MEENTDDAILRLLDSPQSDYITPFSELLEFHEWAEEDPTKMVIEYPMNPVVYAANEAGNSIGTSSRLEGPDGGGNGSGQEKKDGKGRVAFRTMSGVEILDDGFKRRKYGSKMVKNSANPSFEGIDKWMRTMGLIETPKAGEWDSKVTKEIHLMNNKLSELPDNPKCPALVKLFLQSNYDLAEIPSMFFEDMPLLQVLDLSNTSIKSLDIPSISRLVELQELLLRGCQLLIELPPQIGALRNLKVFDLEGTELVYLPKELRELINLECLKVSLYGYADSYRERRRIDAIIPRTTLSKLTQLKELSINVDPYGEWWNVEVKAIFEELPSLRKLETLKLYVPTAELLQQFLQLEWNVDGLSIYSNLSHFRLIVGSQQQRFISHLPHDLEEEFLKLEKCLKYINGEGKTHGFAKALKHANALFLDRHWTIEKLSVFKMDELNELKVCLLVDCNEMQTVFDGSDFYKGGSLQSLLYLGIYYLKNLEFIWKGPVVGSCLPHLKILALHVCPNLTTIFTPMLLQNLVNLEEIIVDDCPKIETLVIQDSSHIGSDNFLPSLKKLSLLDLPELVQISSGLCIAPNLERMVIYNCPKLKILSSVEVCNKEIMEIKGESEWWNALEWNEPEWSSGQPDYLCRAFNELVVEKDLMDQSAAHGYSLHLLMKDREALNSEAPKYEASCTWKEGSAKYPPREHFGHTSTCSASSVDRVTMAGNTDDATFRSLDSPQSDYTTFEFSKLLGFDEWAEEDPTKMVTGNPMNPVYAAKEAGNSIGTSCRLEGPDGGGSRSGQEKKDGKGRVVFKTMSDVEILDDGFKWRKYGKKMLNSQTARNYYRCAVEGCAAKKSVERDREDPRYVIATYQGVHNHQGPAC